MLESPRDLSVEKSAGHRPKPKPKPSRLRTAAAGSSKDAQKLKTTTPVNSHAADIEPDIQHESPVEQVLPNQLLIIGEHKQTYRIGGIPRSFDVATLQRALARALHIRADDIRVYSSAVDIDLRKTATVSFKTRPSLLLSESLEWTLEVTESPSSKRYISIKIDTHFYGFTPLSSAWTEDLETVDVVAIHGWGGHALGSFRDPESCFVWLRDEVGVRFPSFRVWVYGYGSRLRSTDSFGDLQEYARSFTDLLIHMRYKTASTSPIVFIAHSLGGLLLKEALPDMPGRLLQKVYAVLFFGVPSDGMETTALESMVEKPQRLTLQMLDRDGGQTLRERLHNNFCEALHKDSKLVCFYELMATPTVQQDASKNWVRSGEPKLLVTQASATRRRPGDGEGIGINDNHTGIVKFAPNDRYKYPKVENVLSQIAQEAFLVVDARPQEKGEATEAEIRNYEEFMQSLFFSDMANREHEVSNAMPNTCVWIWDMKEFEEWKSNGGLLWLKGSPGTGKSTLLKAIVQKWRELQNGMLAFFFHHRGSQLQHNLMGLFRALLHQIFSLDKLLCVRLAFLYNVRNMTQGSYGEAWVWEENELQQYLRAAVLQFLEKAPLILFIDALDEAGERDATRLVEYLEGLLSLSENKPNRLGVLFTCRWYPMLSPKNATEISVEIQTNEDIMTVVNMKTRSWPDLDSEVIEDIVKLSSGSFQWVILVIDTIINLHKNGKPTRVIKRKLQDIPSQLGQLYENLIATIDDCHMALLIFIWVSFALNPLTITELRQALAFDPVLFPTLEDWEDSDDYIENDEQMSRRLVSLSQGLIEVQGQSNRIQFIHQSVADYVKSEGLDLIAAKVGPTMDGYLRLCISCTKLIANPVKPEYEAFSHHALFYALGYAGEAEKRGSLDDRFLTAFRWPFEVGFGCFQSLDTQTPNYVGLIGPDLFHTLCYNGLCSVLETTLQRRSDGSLCYPNILEKALDDSGLKLFSLTLDEGHNSVIGKLLELKELSLAWESVGNALHLALSKSSDCELFRQILATGRVDINERDQHGRTPLHIAALYGRDEAIKLLLAVEGLEYDIKESENGLTPLHMAAKISFNDTFKILLATGKLNVNERDKFGSTTLHTAAESDNIPAIELLLATEGVDVNIKDYNGGTPLHDAVRKDNIEAVKILLKVEEIELDPKYKNSERTPLYSAAEDGRTDILKLLLATGRVDVNSTDHDGVPPLLKVIKQRNKEIAEILINANDTDLQYRDPDRNATLLYWAVDQGSAEIVQLLLDTGVIDVNAVDLSGESALFRAVKDGAVEIVTSILSTEGVDLHFKDLEDNRTLLFTAVQYRHAAIVEQLLATKVFELNEPDNNGETPLNRASVLGEEGIIRMLLDAINEKKEPVCNWDYYVLLTQAATRGLEDIVKEMLLVFQGMDLSVRRDIFHPALERAANRGYHEIVKHLLAALEDIDMATKQKILKNAITNSEDWSQELFTLFQIEGI